MISPNATEHIISKLFTKPVVENEILIKIVEIIKPEFLIILWNWSVMKNENNNKRTSAKIKTLKNCSKKMLFIFAKEFELFSTE